jgi:hypothetical protein
MQALLMRGDLLGCWSEDSLDQLVWIRVLRRLRRRLGGIRLGWKPLAGSEIKMGPFGALPDAKALELANSLKKSVGMEPLPLDPFPEFRYRVEELFRLIGAFKVVLDDSPHDYFTNLRPEAAFEATQAHGASTGYDCHK